MTRLDVALGFLSAAVLGFFVGWWDGVAYLWLAELIAWIGGKL